MPKLSPDAPKEEKQERMAKEMGKYKDGMLHSGSKRGRIVKSRKQAIAIGLSESGQSLKRKGKQYAKISRR